MFLLVSSCPMWRFVHSTARLCLDTMLTNTLGLEANRTLKEQVSFK